METHPKGNRARILMSSDFGPYAQDDEFGSRSINPMELYHNQVTRAQGSFSLRMFHCSRGIMLIQANIAAPCTVLDFPTRRAFAHELIDGSRILGTAGLSIIFLRWVTGTPKFISTDRQSLLSYLTRSVRRRAAAFKSGCGKRGLSEDRLRSQPLERVSGPQMATWDADSHPHALIGVTKHER